MVDSADDGLDETATGLRTVSLVFTVMPCGYCCCCWCRRLSV